MNFVLLRKEPRRKVWFFYYQKILSIDIYICLLYTSIATYTSYVYKYSGSCKATLKITYSIDNGNLKIKNVKLSEKQKRK